ncbi:MAG: dimethylarginine dimethylaminohydrolase family protein [Candidatus Heimdallarchaeota archaeon]
MFKQAILRKPGKTFKYGLTSSNLGKPDYIKTIIQHSNYVKALIRCGLKTIVLEADDRFPDSTFVEDTAVVNKDLAIITNFGVSTRKGEELEIRKQLEKIYKNIYCIENPGTLEGGDILKVDNQYYIGLSKRTNREGANQLKKILEKYDYSCQIVKLANLLHLKTGIAYIGDNNIIISEEFFDNPIFKKYNIIKVDKDENYAANCIRVNNYVLIAKGYEKLKNSLLDLGYKIIEIEMSEFRKMDGGISCLSIRF